MFVTELDFMQVFVYFLLLWFGFTGTFDCLERHVSEMTCYVLSEMLNSTNSTQYHRQGRTLPQNGLLCVSWILNSTVHTHSVANVVFVFKCTIVTLIKIIN